jgi:flavin reductase (DIM6/NTAB) family NADH-FMN oxidoreductase RutF
MEIDLSALPAREQYKILSSTVVPRPIALVSSRSADGIDNAAPYSFFGVMGEDPAILALGLKKHPDGTRKDTAANIMATGEFVVNMVDEALAEGMNACAASLPPEESEAEAAGLALVASTRVGPPRLAAAPVAFECRLVECLATVPDRDIILGEIVMVHIRDGIFNPETNYIDPEAYHPVGRLFGPYYIRAGDRFELARPD